MTGDLFDQAGIQIASTDRETGIRCCVQLIEHRGVNARSAIAFLLSQILLGNIADEYIKHIAVTGKLRKMTVVVNPMDTAVPARDAVLNVITIMSYVASTCSLMDLLTFSRSAGYTIPLKV